MELMSPGLSIQNAIGNHWLATFSHDFNEAESITFTVRVTKSDKSLPAVQLEAFDRAAELLRVISEQLESRGHKN